jgi:hypothetical protein
MVLQKNAIIGATKSPKVLLVFMKALNTFFDLNPRKYALIRLILKYLSTEIPMARNGYSIELENKEVAAYFLQSQS